MVRAAEWAGWPLEARARRRLGRLADWLRQEAIPAGGLGPNEGDRIERRHLADSLLFARGWAPPDPPRTLLDLGSGVGLPGIPLAILWPETEVTLIDRSGRRVDLARRAVRVLQLGNVTAVQGEATAVQGAFQMVVARAAGPPGLVGEWAAPLMTPDGVTVIGGSHRHRPEAAPGETVVEVDPAILDRTVWLRMITAS